MDKLNLNVVGHVLIKDFNSGEILLSKRNAINYENFSFAIASAMTRSVNANSQQGFIQTMHFGNGGIVVDTAGNITYKEPRVVNITDELYNLTYQKAVDFDPENNVENNTNVEHFGGTTFSDIIVTCTLDYSEPVGQDPFDDTASQEGTYVFDEIGLVSQQGRLLTHLIFHPVQKAANRKIQVVYTVRISAG